MKTAFAVSSAFALAMGTSASAALVNGTLTDDGWVDFFDGNVKDAGVGARLNIATPNPAGAFQYSRQAVFSFDVSAINLANVVSGTMTVTTAGDVSATYDGNSDIRVYLVNNTVDDSVDETTLVDGAGFLTNANIITGTTVDGVSLGDVAVPATAAGQTLTFNITGAALADLANDTNGILSFVAEYRGQENAGYGNFTGMGFDSKDGGTTPATLVLDEVPEPASAALVLGGLGLIAGRRRRA